MSWDIHLREPDGSVVEVDRHNSGAIQSLRGSTHASTTITFNYSYFYYNEIDEEDGIRWLDGKKAKETIDVLEEAIDTLGTESHNDCDSYWCDNPGNAGKDLLPLLEWARAHPDAEWVVT